MVDRVQYERNNIIISDLHPMHAFCNSRCPFSVSFLSHETSRFLWLLPSVHIVRVYYYHYSQEQISLCSHLHNINLFRKEAMKREIEKNEKKIELNEFNERRNTCGTEYESFFCLMPPLIAYILLYQRV